MFQIIFYHKEFMIPIFILLSLSIICQIIMGVLFRKLILETENMAVTGNKSLQQLKLKFSSCCKLHDGIANVSVFVDKYMFQIKIHKISFHVWKHLSGQLVLLAILIAGIGACMGIIEGESLLYIAPFYIISFLGLYGYFAVSSLVDIAGKYELLRTNLIDYLENHLADRLEQTELDMKLIQNESPQASNCLSHEKEASPQKEKASDTPDNNSVFSHQDVNELETLLKEFLT